GSGRTWSLRKVRILSLCQIPHELPGRNRFYYKKALESLPKRLSALAENRARCHGLNLVLDGMATTDPLPPLSHLRVMGGRVHPTAGETMAKVTYDKETTALLVIDPYNDFISEGGKLWDRVRDVAKANNCVPHMLQVLNAARKAKLRVFYALHHR